MTVQQLYNALAVVTGIGLLLFVSLFVLWGQQDRRLDDLEERLGAKPADCATDAMPAVSIRDAPTAVAAAREANRPRPTPFPRTTGRHRQVGS